MSLSREQLQEMQAKLDALKADFLNNGGKVDKVHSNLESLGDHQPVIATKSALDKVVASQNKREVKLAAKDAKKTDAIVKKQGKAEPLAGGLVKLKEHVTKAANSYQAAAENLSKEVARTLDNLRDSLAKPSEANASSKEKPAAKQKSVMSELRDINLAADEIERSISKMQRILRG